MSWCEYEMLREAVNKTCEKCEDCDKCPFESVCVPMATKPLEGDTLKECWNIFINL